MVFDGIPGLEGHASKPTDLRTSMNKFLGNLNVTFRRDKETKGQESINLTAILTVNKKS